MILATTSSAETITVCATGCDHTSINEAIAAAKDGDVVQLAAEVYLEGEVVDLRGKAITLRGTIGPGGVPTSILHGQYAHRVLLSLNGEGADTHLVNLVIRAGRATPIPIPDLGTYADGGGMILIDSPGIRLTNCVFHLNQGSWGGGLYSWRSSPTLLECSFDSNLAIATPGRTLGSVGGGMAVHGGGSPLLDGCTFIGNTADHGAGLYLRGGSTPTLVACRFEGNDAALQGGGLRCFASGPTLEECRFIGNNAEIRGGAIASWDSTVQLRDAEMSGNTAGAVGGSVFQENGSVLDAGGSVWSNNTDASTHGTVSSIASYVLLDGCRFEDNVPAGILHEDGGGSWIQASIFDECCAVSPASLYQDLGGNEFAGLDRHPCPECRGNVDCRGDVVDAQDLGRLLARWGSNDDHCDIDDDGVVGAADLGLLFVEWGPCR